MGRDRTRPKERKSDQEQRRSTGPGVSSGWRFRCEPGSFVFQIKKIYQNVQGFKEVQILSLR